MFESMNTVKQGSVGLGVAIAEFVKKGWCVSVPLNDIQSYDLILDQGDGPKRVQIKTTKFKQSNNYVVQLKSVRPNRTKNTIRNLDKTSIDFVFILCDNSDMYLVPVDGLTGITAVSLGEAYSKYKMNTEG